jgi:hypothetical protein
VAHVILALNGRSKPRHADGAPKKEQTEQQTNHQSYCVAMPIPEAHTLLHNRPITSRCGGRAVGMKRARNDFPATHVVRLNGMPEFLLFNNFIFQPALSTW